MSATLDLSNRLLSEELIGLAALAKRIKSERRQGGMSVQAVWRWARDGVRLDSGHVVKLETVRLCGRYLTSYPAFLRFLEAQTPDPVTPPAPARAVGRREESSRRAGRTLAAAGI